jgi:hypothetical protein
VDVDSNSAAVANSPAGEETGEGESSNSALADGPAAAQDSTSFARRRAEDEPDSDRRGLALLRSLHERGLAFLLDDLFEWSSL